MAVISPFPSFKSQTYYPVGVDCVLYHAYWDGTALDHSSYDCHGTVVGGSFVENGISLDVIDDYVDVVEHQATLAPHTGDISIYGWVKFPTRPTQFPTLLNAMAPTGNCLLWILVYGAAYADNRQWFLAYDFVDSYDYAYYGLVPYGNWVDTADGAWHCIQYVIDRDSVALTQAATIDNVSRGSASDLVTNSYNWQNFTEFNIGIRQGLLGFGGIIGEVLIFHAARSTAEDTDYFNATKARYGL